MNPKPFVSLNHFTVPVAISLLFFHLRRHAGLVTVPAYRPYVCYRKIASLSCTFARARARRSLPPCLACHFLAPRRCGSAVRAGCKSGSAVGGRPLLTFALEDLGGESLLEDSRHLFGLHLERGPNLFRAQPRLRLLHEADDSIELGGDLLGRAPWKAPRSPRPGRRLGCDCDRAGPPSTPPGADASPRLHEQLFEARPTDRVHDGVGELGGELVELGAKGHGCARLYATSRRRRHIRAILRDPRRRPTARDRIRLL